MNEKPVGLKLDEEGSLVIDWSDAKTRVYKVGHLRDNCPCATCREKRKADSTQPTNMLPVLSMEEAQPLKITEMKPVGSYAYSITFSDGHDSGIFTLEHLYELGL